MKMKHNYIVLMIAVISFLASVICIFILPDIVPVHWNVVGQIDQYGSKYVYLFTGTLPIGCYYLMNVTKRIDPYESKIDEKIDAYLLMRDIITLLMSGMTAIMLAGAFISGFRLPSAINILLGLSFTCLGNYMPRVPHNYFMGAKTPWALADETNWKKTQRFSEYVFCISGIMMTITGFLNVTWGMILSLGVLVAGVIFVYIYSWYLYQHNK